jgi:hypothetical protein
MANPFPRTEPAWGLRAYLVLMGCAADRQTVTCDDLARRIDRGGPNLLARPLELVTRWCQRHSLPAIAALVVEQATGLPAPGFAVLAGSGVPDARGLVPGCRNQVAAVGAEGDRADVKFVTFEKGARTGSVDHSRAVPSQASVSTWRPSRLKLARQTPAKCPLSVASSVPVPASQIRAV